MNAEFHHPLDRFGSILNDTILYVAKAEVKMDMGFDDRIIGNIDTISTPTGRALAVKKKELIDLFRKNQSDFNRHAAKRGLPIRINTKHVQQEVHANPGKFKHFFNRQDDRGVLHREQIYTIIDCFVEILRDPTKCGLLLGALQAGKSNTIIALQWIGPINYLLTGRKIYPLYLITSQKSHEAQAKEELALFLRWYGEVQLVRAAERTTLNEYRKLQLDVMFMQNPTLNTYREVVLDGAEDDITEFSPEDFVNRRVHGHQVKIIAEKCKKAINAGYDPWLYLDEGQYGASDREDKDDMETRKPSVSRQILDAIATELGRRPRYIVASATPYEFIDADVWTVNQYLGETYCGLNMFGGRVIAENMDGKIHVPQVASFEETGQDYDLPLFAAGQFSIVTWALELRDPARAESRFERWCKRSGYEGTYDDYRTQVESEVRRCIHWMIAQERKEPVTERYLRARWPSIATDRTTIKRVADAYARPVGICIRLCNNNGFTDEFIERLNLDPNKIEVLPYYTQYDEHGRPIPEPKSVKQFLKRRKRPDLPFVLFVTARARMGDAFPLYVKYFLECSMIASDLNALLQGLLGRACGYFKDTTVIMSRPNWELVMEFVSTNGGHIYTPSRHSTVVGLRRGPFTNILKIPSDHSDPVIQKFLKELHKHTVEKYVQQGRPTLQTHRSKVTRYAPILKIANRLNLFEYLERNRTRLFPQYSTAFEIPRENEPVKNRSGRPQSYVVDPENPGHIRFTFRHADNARGGRSGRGHHTTDKTRDSRTDRARTEDRLDPQINLEKFDPKTSKAIDDRHLDKSKRRPGDWRIHMVALPLKEPVREMLVGTATYPVAHSVFDELLNTDKRRDRDRHRVQVDGPWAKRRRRRAA